MAQVTHETGFLVQGDTQAEAVVNSDRTWKAVRNDAVSLLPIDRAAISYEYFVGGPGEQVEGAKISVGLGVARLRPCRLGRRQRDHDRRAPRDPRYPVALDARAPRDSADAGGARTLCAHRARGGRAAGGGAARRQDGLDDRAAHDSDAAARSRSPDDRLPRAGHERRARRVNRADLYGGASDEGASARGRARKAIATRSTAKSSPGLRDRFLPDGGARRLFRPLWWRTFRYVEVAVQTADEPLVIGDVRALFTAYPFEERGRFESSDPELSRIWEVGWRTARLCAHETYMDTPYWEQLQYIGDARIQALLSLYVGGDDRLVRHAIELFDESRIPDGLTQSRYPTMLPQIIPPFSLFWIGMMHDLYAWGGDQVFAKRYLNGANATLEWFAARLAPSDLLGPARMVELRRLGGRRGVQRRRAADGRRRVVGHPVAAVRARAAGGRGSRSGGRRARAGRAIPGAGGSDWRGRQARGMGREPSLLRRHALEAHVQPARQPPGRAGRPRASGRPGRVHAPRAGRSVTDAGDVLLPVLPVPRDEARGPRRRVPRAPRSLARDAEPRPHHLGGDTRSRRAPTRTRGARTRTTTCSRRWPAWSLRRPASRPCASSRISARSRASRHRWPHPRESSRSPTSDRASRSRRTVTLPR